MLKPIYRLQKSITSYCIKEPGKALFYLFLFIACFTYQNYGISWDENQQRKTGYKNFNYAFKNDEALLEWKDKDYGVGFEMPLIIIEKAFDLYDYREIHLMRHFISHLLFLIAAYFLYKLILIIYQNKLLGVLGFLILVHHPRIYSHSFFNTKDIPFLSIMIICFYLAARAFESKKIKHFIFLGIGIGFLINIRIMGIILPAIIIGWLILDLIIEKSYKRNVLLLITLVVSSSLTLYISWPYLWSDPISNFYASFINMSKFRFDSATLFDGQHISTLETPTNYFYQWFSITTPILFVALFIFGIIAFFIYTILNPFKLIQNNPLRNNSMYFFVALGSLFSIYYFESILYDSWRQLFYLYPCLILLGIFGLYQIKSLRISNWINIGIGVTFLLLIIHSVRQYPNQYVYFNYSVNSNEQEIRKKWELDYWAVSYHQALKYILNHDNDHLIYVAFDHLHPGKCNIRFLPYDQRTRFVLSNRDHCDYFIVNYRWHFWDFEDLQEFEWYGLTYRNSDYCTIFKRKKNPNS